MRSSGALLVFLAGVACLSAIAQTGPDAKQRARAARELGRQGSEAVPQLQAYLKDPVVDVRVEAVKALVEIPSPKTLDALIIAAQDNDPEVQIRATDGLVNFYSPGYVQRGLTATLKRAGTAIQSRWTDVNDLVIDPFVQVRGDVIAVLGKVARGGASMDSRANAARAVGILRGRAALPDLFEALRSKDDKIIYETLIAIQKINDPSAAPRITFLLRDFNEKVQLAALETTGLLRNKDALPQLREAFDRAPGDKVRRAALYAIAMLADESSRDLFSRNFPSKDDDLRAAAAEGLGRLGSVKDRPAIEKAFAEERKMKPRLAEAFALVALGRREVAEFSPLQYLVNTLNSKSWRGIAQAYLVELARSVEILGSLYPAIPRGTRDEKIQLAGVLARSGDRDSTETLDRLTHDPDNEVAQEAIRALRTLRARLP